MNSIPQFFTFIKTMINMNDFGKINAQMQLLRIFLVPCNVQAGSELHILSLAGL